MRSINETLPTLILGLAVRYGMKIEYVARKQNYTAAPSLVCKRGHPVESIDSMSVVIIFGTGTSMVAREPIVQRILTTTYVGYSCECRVNS